MGRIAFNIFVIPLLYFISLFPFWLLYIKSRGLYLLVYYVVGYRKKVVLQNLKNSFPEKSGEEITAISKEFYKHFCDVIFEIIKLLTISKNSLGKRFVMTENADATFRHFENKKQSIIGVLGHCGNWEWANGAYQLHSKQLLTPVYHPLSNKNFDSFMLRLRSRMGANLVAMNALYRELIALRSKNIPTTVGMIADQTPAPETAYWTKFMHQDTPVFNGTEKLSRKFNYPVVYVGVTKLKRGYYSMDTTIVTETPNDLPEGMITELHTRALEKNIIAQPHIWLWTHKRWKHKRPTR